MGKKSKKKGGNKNKRGASTSQTAAKAAATAVVSKNPVVIAPDTKENAKPVPVVLPVVPAVKEDANPQMPASQSAPAPAPASVAKGQTSSGTSTPAKVPVVKKSPPPVELVEEISAPTSTKRGMDLTESVTKAQEKVELPKAAELPKSVPSLLGPAEEEELQKKASDECSCAIL